MRRFFILLSIAAALFCACQEEDIVCKEKQEVGEIGLISQVSQINETIVRKEGNLTKGIISFFQKLIDAAYL